ncbi:endonuclease domain-containing protein [Catellatospora vulcania]|uniref:endonuclease domain-containing protein n=1 Tax=Catellatospora vulcania TaxID=1460450 RepID=UPI001E38E5F2|nr:endonuclease domain-containing protein [Catellatospora vulcania]
MPSSRSDAGGRFGGLRAQDRVTPDVVPRRDAGEIEWILFEQRGVLTTAQARELLTPSKVRHLLATGRWRRLSRGVLLASGSEVTEDQANWMAVLAAGPGAVLAGLAAARCGGLRGRFRRAVTDVLIPAGRRAVELPRTGPIDLPVVRVHRTTLLPEQDVQAGRPRRTSMARSVVDAAAWALEDDEARSLVAAACQQRRVLPEEVTEVALRLPRFRRRSLVLETARLAGGGATALSEIDLVKLCARHGLPTPDLQERRKDAAGRNRYLDAYWRRFQLHVEVDGAHHMDERHWAADMLRQNEVWLQGDRVLRFPAWLLRSDPARVVTQLRAALGAAGWTE